MTRLRDRLHLDDEDDGPGPAVRHVVRDDWNELAEREQGERWLAFAGEDATVWTRLAVRDGRTVATGLLIGMAEPLSTDELRRLPLGRLLAIAARDADNAMRQRLPAEQLDHTFTPGLPPLTRKRGRPGRRGLSEDDLREVADAYRDALKTHPQSPMSHTAKVTSRSLAQTRRLVRKVETLGLTNDTGGSDGQA
jgi:hypothetical protein